MNEVMEKKELVALYSKTFEMTKRQAEEEIDRFALFAEQVIVEEQAGFRLGKVGTFKVAVVPEREHNVPNKPGEKTVVPTHYALRFKANDATKRALKEYVFED